MQEAIRILKVRSISHIFKTEFAEQFPVEISLSFLF